MKRVLLSSLAAATMVVAGNASAAPIYTGTYDLLDAFKSHGVWLGDKVFIDKGKSTQKKDNTFNVVSGSFNVDPSSPFDAQMVGEVFSSTLGGGFTFNVDFNYLCTGVTACDALLPSFSNPQPTGGVNAALVDQEQWDFYKMVPATLVGTGTLTGFELDISEKPSDGSKPFRFGIGADWKNAFELGGAGWFDIDSFSYDTAANAAANGGTAVDVSFRHKTDCTGRCGRGDFNVTDAPEPGTLALLGLGLVAAGAARRRN